MGEFDTLALLSSMLEARTRAIASLNSVEPTMCSMSNNEMSPMAPEIYTCCDVSGNYGHFGFECSYNFYNSHNAQWGQMNSFEEGYEYNQYSNTFDQECVYQPNFSYMNNSAQNFSYHDQQQFEQQYYEPYEQPPLQQFEYPPLQEDLQVSQTNVDVQPNQASEVWDILNKLQKSFEESAEEIKELRTQSLAIESQIAQLASSSTTRQLDFLSSQPIQLEEDESLITLNNDLEYDNLSTLADDVPIEKEEEHATDDEINDVVVEDNVSDDEVTKESNTEMVVVSLPQLAPKLPERHMYSLFVFRGYNST